MRARLRPILIGLLLFLGGATAALFAEHMVLLHHRPSPRTISHRALLNEMDSTLRLTPAQHDSVAAIFARHQPLVDSAWRTINHQLYAAMDSVHRELERVLKPQQTERLHEWMRRQHDTPPPGANGAPNR